MSDSLQVPVQDEASVAPTSNNTASRPAASARMPSLNQLAARMTSNNPPSSNNTNNNNNNGNTFTSAQPSVRPRLATSLLARTSTSSVATSSSAADSTTVQPPTTRSASPALSSQRSSSPAGSNRDGTDAAATSGSEQLTAEHLDRLNLGASEGAATVPSEPALGANGRAGSKLSRGYKNVPTLEAITERLRKARALSVDGTEAPPQPVASPPTNDTALPPVKENEHPLQYPWTLYHDTKARAPFTPATIDPSTPYVPPSTETGAYEAGLTVVGEFDTVETFCRYFNWLKPPSRLERNSNYHLFKSGIKPMWEDKANANGGKWVLTMKSQPQLLDRCWSWLAMALVGEELDEGDEICGAVVSLRSKVDRIQVWTRSKEDVERINGIGRKLVKLLDISEADGIGLEFQYNSDERPTPQKFLSLQASFPQSSFRSTFSPHGPALGARHGSVGFGGGGGMTSMAGSMGGFNTSPVNSNSSVGGEHGTSSTAPGTASSTGFVDVAGGGGAGRVFGTGVGAGAGAFGAGGGGAFGGSWRGGKK